jgi:hypothetical protein
MSSRLDEREIAVAAADATCPRCGTRREADQRYCLECGLALPVVEGSIPELRRRWLRRIGWYPGDWVWISLLTLLVAAGGAASAIAVSEHRESSRGNVFTAPTESVAVTEPTVVPTTRAPGDTSTLPTAPEPKTARSTGAGSRNGRLHWPANENGWTIVLVSYPKTNGRPSALATAARGAKSGLRQVGILDSGRFASLQPGYYVVFSGIYASKADADAGVGTARGAGFGGAYSRQIAR